MEKYLLQASLKHNFLQTPTNVSVAIKIYLMEELVSWTYKSAELVIQ